MQKIMFDDNFQLTQAVQEGWKNMTRRIAKSEKPRYKVGEIVAVAQRYREIEKEIERDGLPLTLKDSILKSPGYRNKMFVKAEHMPHQIRITAWRRERLQEISDEDCLREGIYEVPFCEFAWEDNGKTFKTAREAFAALIDKMSGKRAWDDNPYVDVYEFELVKCV